MPTLYTNGGRHTNGGKNGNGDSPLPTVSGRNLAHCHRTASQRGAIATQLAKGEVGLIRPTAIQAAAITGANIKYVNDAMQLKPETRARVAAGELTIADAMRANGLLEAWLKASPEAKAALGAVVGADAIWNSSIEPSLE